MKMAFFLTAVLLFCVNSAVYAVEATDTWEGYYSASLGLSSITKLGISLYLFVGVLSLACGVLCLLFPKLVVKLNRLLVKFNELLVKLNEWETRAIFSNNATRIYRIIIGVLFIATSIFIFTFIWLIVRHDYQ